MKHKKNLPLECPACSFRLNVKSLECPNCTTVIEGSFGIPLLASLAADDQHFIIDFVKSSGSLKEIARQRKLSYPTIRNRLNEIIARLEIMESSTDEINNNQK